MSVAITHARITALIPMYPHVNPTLTSVGVFEILLYINLVRKLYQRSSSLEFSSQLRKTGSSEVRLAHQDYSGN